MVLNRLSSFHGEDDVHNTIDCLYGSIFLGICMDVRDLS